MPGRRRRVVATGGAAVTAEARRRLTDIAGIFEMARALCLKHDVRTPAEAFALEGIAVVRVAA